jgi:hypothetical protein
VGKKGNKEKGQPKMNLPGVAQNIGFLLCAAMLFRCILNIKFYGSKKYRHQGMSDKISGVFKTEG